MSIIKTVLGIQKKKLPFLDFIIPPHQHYQTGKGEIVFMVANKTQKYLRVFVFEENK